MLSSNDIEPSEWYAINTRREFRAEEYLSPLCAEVFLPTESVVTPEKNTRIRPLIPHVLFVRTTESNLLSLEESGRKNPELSLSFWIYRYPSDRRIQVIPRRHIELLRLLSSGDASGCEIYHRTDFKEGARVRVTAGIYAGLEGTVQRVRKNKHVVVRIEGLCAVLLPYLHPDLLQFVE